MDFKIKDRIALDCGSSRGLGWTIAKTLAVEGCRVAINGRDVKRVELASGKLVSDAAVDLVGFPADVSEPAEAENPVRYFRGPAVPEMREQRWGRIVCGYLTGVAL